jgi:hypothetical protein
MGNGKPNAICQKWLLILPETIDLVQIKTIFHEMAAICQKHLPSQKGDGKNYFLENGTSIRDFPEYSGVFGDEKNYGEFRFLKFSRFSHVLAEKITKIF